MEQWDGIKQRVIFIKHQGQNVPMVKLPHCAIAWDTENYPGPRVGEWKVEVDPVLREGEKLPR